MKQNIFRMLSLTMSAAMLVALSACETFKKDKASEKQTPAVSAKKTTKKKAAKKASAKKAAPKAPVASVKKDAPKAAVKKVQIKPMDLSIAFDKESGIYKINDTAKITISFLKNGKQTAGQKIGYYISPGFGKQEMTVFTSKEQPTEFTYKCVKPGSVFVETVAINEERKVQTYEQNGKEIKVTLTKGLIVSPEMIHPGFKEPADFRQFWDANKAELAKIPVKVINKKEVPCNKNFKCWDVQVRCIGSVPVSGYLTMPKDAKSKSLPVIVSYHGAGVRSSGKNFNPKAIRFDVNAHGVENGQSAQFYQNLRNGILKGYAHLNAESREKYYFRNLFLRVIRAVEYVKTLPEWNQKDLIVLGGSQGGAQAIVAASMDPQVSLMCAMVPAMCDHGGYLNGRVPGWPKLIRFKNGKPLDEQIVAAAPYYDVAFFAKYVKCESYFTVGLIDTTCSPSSVYAAFNNIPVKNKYISAWPTKSHAGTYSKEYDKRLSEILNAASSAQ